MSDKKDSNPPASGRREFLQRVAGTAGAIAARHWRVGAAGSAAALGGAMAHQLPQQMDTPPEITLDPDALKVAAEKAGLPVEKLNPIILSYLNDAKRRGTLRATLGYEPTGKSTAMGAFFAGALTTGVLGGEAIGKEITGGEQPLIYAGGGTTVRSRG